MRFRNAFRLVINNFANVYKLLLFRLIANLIFLSLSYAIITLGLHVIFGSAEAHTVVQLIGEFFKALVSGDTAFLTGFSEEFTQAIADLLLLMGTQIGSIVGSVIGVALMYLLSRFVSGTAMFAMATILNDKMETYGNTRFSSAYFKNLTRATVYHAVYVPVSFVYDLVSLLACWFFFFYTPSFLPSWGFFTVFIALALSMTAFVCLQALKLTFVSAWIPAIVTDGTGVFKSCRQSFRSVKGFAGRFSGYLMAIYLIVILNVICAACTFGSMLLLTVPASYLFILGLQFVNYYEDTGKKYFLSYRKISGADGKPEGMGD